MDDFSDDDPIREYDDAPPNLEESAELGEEAASLALAALGWILTDDDRAHRFLDLTGLDAGGLRDAVALPSTHRAVLDFLCSYEPDLIAAARALDIAPEAIANARYANATFGSSK